jgi:hypothetical protein
MKFCNGQTGAIHGDRIANVAISQDRSRVCDGQGATSDIMCDDGDCPKMLDLYFWLSSDREMGYKSYQTSEHCFCRRGLRQLTKLVVANRSNYKTSGNRPDANLHLFLLSRFLSNIIRDDYIGIK